MDFLYAEAKDLKLSWKDFYHEASYIIGVDFFLSLDMDNSKYVMNVTQHDLFKANTAIKVEEMWTIWSGLCYKITPMYKTQNQLLHHIRIYFNASMPDEDLPKMDMIITSSAGASRIMDLEWVGIDYALELDPRNGLEYDVSLQAEVYKSLPLTSKCQQEDPFYKCVLEK